TGPVNLEADPDRFRGLGLRVADEARHRGGAGGDPRPGSQFFQDPTAGIRAEIAIALRLHGDSSLMTFGSAPVERALHSPITHHMPRGEASSHRPKNVYRTMNSETGIWLITARRLSRNMSSATPCETRIARTCP